jgi:hypothetical protein
VPLSGSGIIGGPVDISTASRQPAMMTEAVGLAVVRS